MITAPLWYNSKHLNIEGASCFDFSVPRSKQKKWIIVILNRLQRGKVKIPTYPNPKVKPSQPLTFRRGRIQSGWGWIPTQGNEDLRPTTPLINLLCNDW